ncbi:tail fiber assembly protein [Klebsiella aerogenes]|uniref:tail fiber assembly protein n=1 Tax=Klebsiella aerogenes TaxID=548 RepID=UPI00057402C2|nr:tail fiber assembly protein [Klebsiella aerogenes]KHM28136.1 tail assembly protein [Klebsiella aerogenes]HDU3462263.1 tail fiber assembly protein [Klebsiella aerogenes]
MTKAELNDDMIAVVAGYITVHNFDGDTLEYTGVSNEYLAVGVGIPAYSSIDAPGEKKDGFAICRTRDLHSWEYIDDHRGETVYSTETGNELKIKNLGNYPDGITVQKPSTPYDRWDGKKWVTDVNAQHSADVELAKGKKLELLSEAQKKINFWQTELLLGMISDEDKSQLTEWVKYIKAVQALDINSAPAIQWPESPEL